MSKSDAIPSILIVFYSRTGATQHVAMQLAEKLGSHTLVIRDARPRDGMLGYIRSLLEAIRRSLPGIRHPYIDLARYDLVVLGSPVWAGHLSSPMRRFLYDSQGKIRRAAFFCTMGGRGADTTFSDMQSLIGKAPEATLALIRGDALSENRSSQIDEFVAKLEQACAHQSADL